MIGRLLTGILATVFLPLGLAFIAIGLLAGDVDRGEPEGFVSAGIPLAAVGLALAAAFLMLRRREAARRARRTRRAVGEVVSARMNTGVRSNGRFALRLTVRFDPAGTATTAVMWDPMRPLPPGERIEVVYDPEDPASFEPAP